MILADGGNTVAVAATSPNERAGPTELSPVAYLFWWYGWGEAPGPSAGVVDGRDALVVAIPYRRTSSSPQTIFSDPIDNDNKHQTPNYRLNWLDSS